MPWKNFSIWRGRLPHWRADDVTYWVTFSHKRDLQDSELRLLFNSLFRPQGKQWNLVLLCTLPHETHLLFSVNLDRQGRPYELSDVVEKSKVKTGRAIVKKSGERWPPFYHESYDRIIRDDVELESRVIEIMDFAAEASGCDDPEAYVWLWMAGKD